MLSIFLIFHIQLYYGIHILVLFYSSHLDFIGIAFIGSAFYICAMV